MCVCVCVCVCERERERVCVCVCVCVCGRFPGGVVVSTVCCHSRVAGSNPTRGKRKKGACIPSLQHLHHPTSLTSCDGHLALLGCKFTGYASVVSCGSRWDFGCPHPQAERYGQSSCEFLARLQELLACSQCLLSAQASWLCVTTMCVCMCIYVWQLQVEKEHYSYHVLTPFDSFCLTSQGYCLDTEQCRSL